MVAGPISVVIAAWHVAQKRTIEKGGRCRNGRCRDLGVRAFHRRPRTLRSWGLLSSLQPSSAPVPASTRLSASLSRCLLSYLAPSVSPPSPSLDFFVTFNCSFSFCQHG